VHTITRKRWLNAIAFFEVLLAFYIGQITSPLIGLLCLAVGMVLYHAVERLCFRATPIPRIPGCPICGYNLIGNVSGTCPECGTPFEVYARSGPGVHTWEIRSASMPPKNSDISN
jgi:hypothetical protein